jgi:uncharacterized small protein (DUF1192 family)
MTAVFAGVRHGERPLYSKEEALKVAERAEIEAEIAALRRELPRLRPAVQSSHNEERFEPVQARAVRMHIHATNGAEPCIDELEVWSGETNVALSATPSLGELPLGSTSHAQMISGLVSGFQRYAMSHLQ